MSNAPTKPPRPVTGGFFRPFGTAEFIIEYLKGNGPEGSQRIDTTSGATMTDIHHEYKSALRRARARNAVQHDEGSRIKRGRLAYTQEEHNQRLQYYLDRMPYKLLRMRYSSFTRYFGHLERLGWVERAGETEPSTVQDDYPAAPPRVFYQLTKKGWEATPAEIADPVRTLYDYSREQRSAKRRSYYRV